MHAQVGVLRKSRLRPGGPSGPCCDEHEKVTARAIPNTQRSRHDLPLQGQPRRAAPVVEHQETLFGVVSLVRDLCEKSTESASYWAAPTMLSC